MNSGNHPVRVHYHGHAVDCREGETLLDAFLRSGVDINFSCRSGICHRCMVRCVEGEVPFDAKRKLPEHQQSRGCLLSCQCRPAGPMVLVPKSPEDVVARCLFQGRSTTGEGRLQVRFEAVTRLDYRKGQLARLSDAGMRGECVAVFMNEPGDDEFIHVMPVENEQEWPAWLLSAEEGVTEFCLQGPLPVEPANEVVPIAPDPGLWDALGGDNKIRALLETFYAKVYADEALSPFFARVTMQRIIGKQFAFLKQHMTGEAVFIGENPKNSHHWMVIPDALFDHRQNLMLHAMQEHGIPDELISRLVDYEEQFRPDIVKYQPWKKKVGDLLVDTEVFEVAWLEEATLCDYCNGEVSANTEVRYHKRLGLVSCGTCNRRGAEAVS